MHICPQEIIGFMMAFESLKPAIGMVGYWCKACVDGLHKSCEDHAADTAIESEPHVQN